MRFVACVLVFLVGCHRAPPPAPAPVASTPSVPSAVASSPPSSPPLPDAPVGLVDFGPVPAPAIAANDRGVKLLANGKVVEARAAFEEALAKGPTFVIARYDLACAKARAGSFAEARADLELAFEADFVGLRAHAAVDTDLTAFWASPEGIALAAKLPAYEARFQRVIDRGVRAMLFHGAVDGAGRGQLRPSVLRVGVFDPVTSRFVAIAPRAGRPVTAYAAPDVPYAIVVTGEVRSMLGGDLDTGQALDAVQAYPYDASGKPLGEVKLGGSSMSSGALWMKREGLRLVGYDAMDGESTPNRDWSIDFGHPSTREASAKTFAAPTDRATWLDAFEIGYSHWGPYVRQAAPRGYTYAKQTLTLPDGKTIPIPKASAGAALAAIVPSPKADRVVLVWNDDHLQCSGDPIPGKYRLALVDVAAATVASLDAGSGAAAAAFDRDGVLYLQKGGSVTRPDGTALPKGVLLVPPIEQNAECGF